MPAVTPTHPQPMSTTTATRCKPILFSDEMVKALLDGRKTQTRRIVKPQPLGEHDKCFGWFGKGLPPQAPCAAKGLYCESSRGLFVVADCPYEVGDQLWVRETWGVLSWTCVIGDRGRQRTEVVFRAGPHPFDRDRPHGWEDGKDKWRPSIHMPRAASRITLSITDVRVERVQDISEADAKAEGCDGNCGVGYIPAYQKGPCAYHFASLWDSINGEGSWASNPFCWAITFRRLP